MRKQEEESIETIKHSDSVVITMSSNDTMEDMENGGQRYMTISFILFLAVFTVGLISWCFSVGLFIICEGCVVPFLSCCERMLERCQSWWNNQRRQE